MHVSRPWKPTIGLVVCLGAMLLVLAVFATLGDLRADLPNFLTGWTVWFVLLAGAWWWCQRVDVPRALWVILIGGVLLRVASLALPATLSDDWVRYLWDGRLTVHGLDPYAAKPSDASLAELHDDTLLPGMNSPDYFTVYPPISQAAFASAWWLGSGNTDAALFWIKAIFGMADMLGVLAVVGMLGALGIDRRRVVLYAWNPLAVVELVGSVHSEALLVAPMAGCVWAAARRRDALAGGLLAVAVWVKLFPVLAVLPLAKFVGWRRACRAALACLVVGGLIGWPMLRPDAIANVRESLNLYAGVFSFNHGLFHTVWWAGQQLSSADPYDVYRGATRWMLGAFLVSYGLFIALKRIDSNRDAAMALLFVFGGYLVANATLHPWYVAWVLCLVPAAVGFARPWLWLSFAVGWSYLAYSADPPAVPWPVVTIEWVVFAGLIGFDLLRRVGPLRPRRVELSA